MGLIFFFLWEGATRNCLGKSRHFQKMIRSDKPSVYHCLLLANFNQINSRRALPPVEPVQRSQSGEENVRYKEKPSVILFQSEFSPVLVVTPQEHL